jgi:hypothetical protein
MFDADVKLYTAVVLAGVRVYGPFFLEGGARYHGVHATFAVLDFAPIDWDPGRWSPAVGATFRPVLSKRWRLFAHIDRGGLGVNDVSTTNGEARIEWRPISHLAITAGYAFCTTTLDGTLFENTAVARPVHLQQTLHGPVAGIGIPF